MLDFLAKYSVYVPHLPPEAFRDMPDLRSSAMNDMMPNQIPENTTYQATIEQQQSPPSYQLSPGSISSQGKLVQTLNEKQQQYFIQILFFHHLLRILTKKIIIILMKLQWILIFLHLHQQIQLLFIPNNNQFQQSPLNIP
jgi:hypothetical protein